MISVITTFQLPQPIALAEASALFQSTAPHYRDVPGLLHKVYWRSQQGDRVGGLYLWASRADAEAVYTPQWRARVRQTYQCEAEVLYLDSPVVVDNVNQQILIDAAV